eukprot:gene2207-4293_t
MKFDVMDLTLCNRNLKHNKTISNLTLHLCSSFSFHTLSGHPFDTTKTRLQTSPPKFYAGTIDCVKKTLKWEGLGGFYKGIWSPLAGQMFFRAASFATFHNTVKYVPDSPQVLFSTRFKDVKLNQDKVPSAFRLMLAGSITGLFISVIETPIDLIKTKLQIQIFSHRLNPGYKPLYNTVGSCVQYVYSTYGLRGLWQGWSGTVIRNVPANGMFFPVNELMKRAMADHRHIPVSELEFHNRLMCGAAAGLGYWMSTFPLDAIKARMQSAQYGESGGWMATARRMAKEGGWRSFTRGIGPCAARAVPACAAMFATVDIVRDSLQKLHTRPTPDNFYSLSRPPRSMYPVPMANSQSINDTGGSN